VAETTRRRLLLHLAHPSIRAVAGMVRLPARSPSARPFRPLATTLIRHIMTAAAICTVAVAGVQALLTWSAHRASFESEVQSVAEVNLPLLTVSLRESELEAIAEQMRLIAERPQIAYAVLHSRLDYAFERGDLMRRGDRRTISLTIAENGVWLGTLAVAPNMDYYRAELARDLLRVAAGAALLTGLICAVVFVILRRQLQLPMQHIARFAASLTPSELTRPLALERPQRPWHDEIDQLAEGFRLLQDDIRSHVEALDREVAHRTQELERANRQLEALARRDPLTGLANRRRFDHEKLRAWGEMLTRRHVVAVLMIDVDHFKNYNDYYGHAAGDDCLIAIARLLAATFGRQGELAARLGGEEFAVLLERVDFEEALARADAVRESVCALRLPHPTSVFGCVTVSIGVCAVEPDTIAAARADQAFSGMVEVLGRADQAMYQAKAAGRNKVVGLRLENDHTSVFAGAGAAVASRHDL
jgi:two-component system, cell cycle response regulator